MPANLPPEYFEAEKIYRAAKSAPEKIAALEAMLSAMPKHKGTDRLRAELTGRIAKFSEEAQRKPTLGRRAPSWYVRKEGAGQAVLVGLPNVGKSQLLDSLTEASPEIADYPFTTHTTMLGMVRLENIQIQLVDMPPLVQRSIYSWVPLILRNADVLLVVVDLSHSPLEQMEAIFDELSRLRIRPVWRAPEEGSEESAVQKKFLLVGNKRDLEGSGDNYQLLKMKYASEFPTLAVSAKEEVGLEELKQELYRVLDIIRVYTKAPNEKPDFSDPIILKKGSTIEDAAESIHKDLRRNLKYAQIWGSGKFSGQRVKRHYTPENGDVIELHV